MEGRAISAGIYRRQRRWFKAVPEVEDEGDTATTAWKIGARRRHCLVIGRRWRFAPRDDVNRVRQQMTSVAVPWSRRQASGGGGGTTGGRRWLWATASALWAAAAVAWAPSAPTERERKREVAAGPVGAKEKRKKCGPITKGRSLV